MPYQILNDLGSQPGISSLLKAPMFNVRIVDCIGAKPCDMFHTFKRN